MKRITVFALAILCCTVSHAREFNVALGGSVSGEGFGDAFDAGFYTLDARYYFDAVSDSDGPYREAAFIHPAGSIAVRYESTESHQKDIGADSDNWQLRGRYYNRTHGWYVSAGIGRGESDTRVGPEVPDSVLQAPDTPVFRFIDAGSASFSQPLIIAKTDADDKNYTLGLGRYFGARTTLDLSYSRGETDADMHSITCFDDLPLNIFSFSEPLAGLRCLPSGFVTHADTETDRLQVTAKHLGEFAHMPLALRGEIGYLKSSMETEPRFQNSIARVAIDPSSIDFDLIVDAVPLTGAVVQFPQLTSFSSEGWNTAADITLYPRNRLGLRISYGYEDIENFQTKTYSAALEWFITHSFAVSLSYTDIDFENSLDNNDSVALRLSGRF